MPVSLRHDNANVRFPVFVSEPYRADDRGESKDEQDIEYVGAYHIANGYVSIAFYGPRDADDEFRARRPEPYYCKAYYEFADSCPSGDGRCSVYKPVGAQDNESKADKQHDDIHCCEILVVE